MVVVTLAKIKALMGVYCCVITYAGCVQFQISVSRHVTSSVFLAPS